MNIKLRCTLLYLYILLLPIITFLNCTFLSKHIYTTIELSIVFLSIINCLLVLFKKSKNKLLIWYFVFTLLFTILLIINGKQLHCNIMHLSLPIIFISALLSIDKLNKKSIVTCFLVNVFTCVLLTGIGLILHVDIDLWLISIETILIIALPIIYIYVHQKNQLFMWIILVSTLILAYFFDIYSVLIIATILTIIDIVYALIKAKDRSICNISIKTLLVLTTCLLSFLLPQYKIIEYRLSVTSIVNHNYIYYLFYGIPLYISFYFKTKDLFKCLKKSYEILIFYFMLILINIICLFISNVNILESTTLGIIYAIAYEYIKPVKKEKVFANKVSVISIEELNDEAIAVINYLSTNNYDVDIYAINELERKMQLSNINIHFINSAKRWFKYYYMKRELIKQLNDVNMGMIIAFDQKSLSILKQVNNGQITKIYRNSSIDTDFKYTGADYIVNTIDKGRQTDDRVYYLPSIYDFSVPIESPLKNPSILAISSNYKQTLSLIDIYINIESKDWKLFLLCNHNKKVSRYIKSNELTDKISIIDSIPSSLIEYSLLIAYSIDDLANSYLPNILGNGLPCICYNNINSDLIIDNKNGYLVDCYDDLMYTECINTLIRYSDKRRVFGKESIKLVNSHSAEVLLPLWLELFEKIEENIITRK